MTQLALATGAYSRQYGTLSSQLINCMAEKADAGPVPDQRLPRPGLQSAYSLGSGPNRGLFYNLGINSGRLLSVSGTQALLSDGTNLGTIAGTDLVRFDSSPTQLVAVSSGKAYLSTSGSVFAQITDPDLPPPSDVRYIGGYFVYPVMASTRFYYSEVNDAGNIDGLNFESVETTADPIIGTDILGDEIVFFKPGDIEFWSLTGDANNPFQKSPGTRYMRGCASINTICRQDNALFWVGDDRVVYRSGQVPQRVSDHGIEDKLRQCPAISDCVGWAASFEGHDLYVLRIAGIGTYVYDVSALDWAQWTSFGSSYFRAITSSAIDGVTYVGDDATGTIWTLAQGVNTDGVEPIVREASAFLPIQYGQPRCNNVMLQCVRGRGNPVDPGSDPMVEMCYSDDLGQTFSQWRARPLGKEGQYSKKAIWRKQGLMRSPGRLFRFRSSDPVMSVFQSVSVNEARP